MTDKQPMKDTLYHHLKHTDKHMYIYYFRQINNLLNLQYHPKRWAEAEYPDKLSRSHSDLQTFCGPPNFSKIFHGPLISTCPPGCNCW